MLARILVPVDGSSFSEETLPLAIEIARRTSAELHIARVHITQGSLAYLGGGPPYYDPRWEAETRAEEERHLLGLLDNARSAGVVARGDLLEGPVVGALEEHATRLDIDLVIMTTHGRGGISRVWLGSVADSLMRRSHRPILALRPQGEASAREPVTRFERMLIPLDGSAIAERVIEPAAELARAMGAACTLARVIPPLYTVGEPRDRAEAIAYLEKIAAFLRVRGLEVRTAVIAHEQPLEGVLIEAAESGVDLIAMATHGRGGWRRMALGSVADQVLRAATVPVLLISPAAGGVKGSAAGSVSDGTRHLIGRP